MNEMIILFLIFGTLFVVEKKSINLLAYYIGMVIIIAIVISNFGEINNNFYTLGTKTKLFYPTQPPTHLGTGVVGPGNVDYNVGISYISYILVLVQISALTILFGFIIMLFPKNNTDPAFGTPGYKIKTIYQTSVYPPVQIENKDFSNTKVTPTQMGGGERVIDLHIIKILFISFLIFFWFILLFLTKYLTFFYHIFFIGNPGGGRGYLYNLLFDIFSQYTPQENIPPKWGVNSTANFLNKLSSLLYSEFSNIFKFLIITIILLFAIIGLFFLLYPTFTTPAKLLPSHNSPLKLSSTNYP